MKKFFFILMIGQSFLGYGQGQRPDKTAACNDGCITGNTSINVNQTYTFTSTATAQCSSCYDWDINGNSTSSDNSTVGTLQIVGSDMGQTVSIKGISAGTFSIQLTYFDETGCHTCCFNGSVGNPPPNCCIPTYQGAYTCQGEGGPYTNAILNIQNNTSCTVDYSSITQIIIDTDPWIISGTGVPGSTIKTINGPFTSTTLPGITFKVLGGCQPYVSGLISYVFNNGCGTIVDEFHIDNPNMLIAPQKESVRADINVFPNPASSVIRFDGADLSRFKISITNDKGVEIIHDARIDNEINIEQHPKGSYYYRITNGTGVVKEGTIIKN